MDNPIVRWNPFTTADAWRLALVFGVVYFAQGMWNLPTQAMTVLFKERGLSAAEVADFQLLGTVPWLLKPFYGLLSDFVPLFGRRRTSYFLLTSGLAAASAFAIALMTEHSYERLAVFFTLMALGLAFTDVLTDALMVEAGRPRGLTGAFQSVQWAAIYGAMMVVGIVGGHFAEARNLHTAFAVAGCFPLISFTLVLLFVREPPSRADRAGFLRTWASIRWAAKGRELWIVAAFIFFFNFSPSFGPAFLYYQTDVLGFGQRFIGVLSSVGALGFVAGAVIYAPVSRRVPLRTLMVWIIGIAAAGMLAYLFYRGPVSAVVIDLVAGMVTMAGTLVCLDLAAKSCPPRAEGTFFALLMAVFNLGLQLSQNVGGRLYDALGFTPLVLISAATTALALLFLPLIDVDAIEARAQARAAEPVA